MGCYTDSASRALSNQLLSSGATVESCVAAVKAQGLAYAGLQYGQECWGGNALTTAKVGDSECSMPCTASPTEQCGGSFRNSVYATGLVPAPTPPAPPPAPAPAPIATGNCANLGTAGTWQNITPPGSWQKAVNGTVAAAIVVDPFAAGRLWLGTGNQNSEIWRSDDCGGSWAQVNTGPGSVGDRITYGGVGDGGQWSMMVDPSDRNILYTVSGYGAQSLWKSIDGGYSWTDILHGSEYDTHAAYHFVNNVSMDAGNHFHLLVSTHGECSAPYQPSCLAETVDGGKSWRVMTAPEGWSEGGGVVMVTAKTWVWCGSTMFVTEDAGANWLPDRLAGGGSCEAEYTIRPLKAAANGKYYLGSRSGVLRSADGAHWEHMPGTTGAMVMVAQGSTRLFAANQWSPSIQTALLSADEKWSDIPAPPQVALGTDGGIPFLAYDEVHHILYASMFSGGVARMVIKQP